MRITGFRGQDSFNPLPLSLTLDQKVLYFLFSRIQDMFSQITKHENCQSFWYPIFYFWSCQLPSLAAIPKAFLDSSENLAWLKFMRKELLVQSRRILFRIKMQFYNLGVSEVAIDRRWELTACSLPSTPKAYWWLEILHCYIQYCFQFSNYIGMSHFSHVANG